jgi:2-oxoglutarate dehydrogenase E1 component
MNLDWGMGEHLAFASLVSSGYAVRLTGQDAGRGTFTHRHAVLHDQNRERWDAGTYVPLQNIAEGQAPFTVIDSVLSEEAVLGFEYGYSTATEHPDHLGSPVRRLRQRRPGGDRPVHQLRRSEVGPRFGLVMMLPHGYEGQGPEHSSARPSASCSCAPTTTCKCAADHRLADLPRAASPDGAPVPQAAGHHDAEIAAA